VIKPGKVCIALLIVLLAGHVETRKPAVAGSFYPSDPAALAAAVDGYLVKAGKAEGEGRLLALVEPRAGYEYSGQLAASGLMEVRRGNIYLYRGGVW